MLSNLFKYILLINYDKGIYKYEGNKKFASLEQRVGESFRYYFSQRPCLKCTFFKIQQPLIFLNTITYLQVYKYYYFLVCKKNKDDLFYLCSFLLIIYFP